MANTNGKAAPRDRVEKPRPRAASLDATVPELDDGPGLFEYLNTKKGHELASRLVTLIEEVKKATIDRTSELQKQQLQGAQTFQSHTILLRGGILLSVIVATGILVAIGKFEANVGILFGTLVGYVFGRKSDTM